MKERRNSSSLAINSPHKGQWRGTYMFSLICTRINGWVNNDDAGDLRRHRVHYDVTVMWPCFRYWGEWKQYNASQMWIFKPHFCVDDWNIFDVTALIWTATGGHWLLVNLCIRHCHWYLDITLNKLPYSKSQKYKIFAMCRKIHSDMFWLKT